MRSFPPTPFVSYRIVIKYYFSNLFPISLFYRFPKDRHKLKIGFWELDTLALIFCNLFKYKLNVIPKILLSTDVQIIKEFL